MSSRSAVEKYLSNPIEIQAILRDGTVERDREIVDFIQENNGDFVYREETELPQERAVTSYFTIMTPTGEELLPVGWYLIKGVDGELTPCSKESFRVKFKPLRRS